MSRQFFTRRGFTLVEVLVAVAIIGLSLAAVVASMAQMIDSGNAMRERTYAAWIAQNRITEVRVSPRAPEVGDSTGTVEYANTEWTWEMVISETGVNNLFRIDVSVGLADEGGSIRTVTGFVGSPAPRGEANGKWLMQPRGTRDGGGAPVGETQ